MKAPIMGSGSHRSIGLADLLQSSSAPAIAADAESGPLDVRPSHFPARAKRVVHFFLNGGPSHVDTFDPKPALREYEGQPLPETLRTERKTGAAFPSPFEFRRYGESGLEVSEIFSKTAAHIDDIAGCRDSSACATSWQSRRCC